MSDRHLNHLSPLAARHAFARPKLILGIVTMAALGWVYVALTSAHVLHVYTPSAHAWTADDFGAAALMWCAMTLAMMLPSAMPMILTYAEIADTAARKGERIVSPWVITAGYIAAWLGFAVAAALLQGALTQAALLDAGSASAGALMAAAFFVGAGLYQFSALKDACLTQCRRPFPLLFANWTTRTSGVFRLGLQHGLYCLGCCWLLMLLMFTVGVMNIVWMLVLGVVVIGEKMATTVYVSRAIGLLLIVIGAAFALSTTFPPS
jgi:predicted metal-binding membrane protein